MAGISRLLVLSSIAHPCLPSPTLMNYIPSCRYCEDARPHPLPTVYSLPQQGTGQKSKFRKLLKKADRVFRLYAAGTSYLSPAEESALRKVVKVGSHKGEVYLLPSGAFVLV
ncbi:hypothetical protein CERSUDRAFT_81262 [Gelatoporia subvermispora B]|uniref:Uncharacterized protein n=1 Tax=Ceriporiopsis subvermispora (strain B) TaxID=914234 RepID=M2RM89_CERS8|nr:hypothetical protein CERSUDRAFT_81262 [Gelatoporia subvermispora B]